MSKELEIFGRADPRKTASACAWRPRGVLGLPFSDFLLAVALGLSVNGTKGASRGANQILDEEDRRRNIAQLLSRVNHVRPQVCEI